MKFAYNQEVYIKKGFFRGYKGKIMEYKEIETKNQETEQITKEMTYKVKVNDIANKEPIWLSEADMIAYGSIMKLFGKIMPK